jgi:hypothetical protein
MISILEYHSKIHVDSRLSRYLGTVLIPILSGLYRLLIKAQTELKEE